LKASHLFHHLMEIELARLALPSKVELNSLKGPERAPLKKVQLHDTLVVSAVPIQFHRETTPERLSKSLPRPHQGQPGWSAEMGERLAPPVVQFVILA